MVSHPKRARIPGTSRAVSKRQQRVSSKGTAPSGQDLKDMACAFADRSRSAKQPGVASSAAEGRRIVIVDLAHEKPAAPLVVSCGRRPREPCLRRMELEILEAAHLLTQRIELQRQGSGVLEDESEEHEPQIAVDRGGPGYVLEWSGADGWLETLASRCVAKERLMRRQAAAVRQ
jgi:hypothetical protein